MAEVAGTLVDALLQRCRDQQALGSSPPVDDDNNPLTPNTLSGRAFARKLLSYAQMLINGAQEQVLSTFTLTTNPFQQVYNISGLIQDSSGWGGSLVIDDCVRIVGVRDILRDLNHVQFRTLAHIDRHWFRTTGTQFTTWSMLGADVLLLYPSLQSVVSLTVVYVNRTAYLTDDTTATVLQDEILPEVLDIAQSLYHLKHRDMQLLPQILERLGKRYAPNKPSQERA